MGLPLSTRSDLVIRRSRAFKNWLQRASLLRNADRRTLSLFKKPKKRSSDSQVCPRAKNVEARCRKTAKITAFLTSKRSVGDLPCLCTKISLLFRRLPKKRLNGSKRTWGAFPSFLKRFLMHLISLTIITLTCSIGALATSSLCVSPRLYIFGTQRPGISSSFLTPRTIPILWHPSLGWKDRVMY